MRSLHSLSLFVAIAHILLPAAAEPVADGEPAKLPVAHVRRRHDEHRHGSDRYRRNQVSSRQAANKWAARGGLAKRATASCLSNVAYGQCGGLLWIGSTCCPSGYTCTYSNDWYSQCLPGSATTTTATSTSTSSSASASPSCSSPNAAYGQCGGIGWSGSTCCVSGYTCVFSSDYYSQCQPGTASTTTTTSSTSSTSSSTSTKPSSTSTSSASSTSTSTSSTSSSVSRTSTSTSASASPSSCTSPNAAYGQCGGIGWSGSTCCVSGYTCVFSNDYYSQCQPGGTTSSSSTTSTTSSSSSKTSTSTSTSASASPSSCTSPNAAYGQCGGIGWSGSTCCVSGYTCTYSNDYYSQCIPGGTTSSTSTTTTSSSSSKASTSSSTSTSSSASSSSSKTSTSASTSASASASSCTSPNSAYAQCGGIGFSGSTCCVSGYTCTYSNDYYSQCLPGGTTSSASSTSSSSSRSTTGTSTSSSSSSVSRTSTSTSSSATPTQSQTCNSASQGSDGCCSYAPYNSGNVTLYNGATYQSGGHCNYQAIACSAYTPGQTYLHPGSSWNAQSFGVSFDPNNGQPGGKYIGQSTLDTSAALAYFGSSYCITWVQISNFNQHWGEGGQSPICTSQCGK